MFFLAIWVENGSLEYLASHFFLTQQALVLTIPMYLLAIFIRKEGLTPMSLGLAVLFFVINAWFLFTGKNASSEFHAPVVLFFWLLLQVPVMGVFVLIKLVGNRVRAKQNKN